MYPNYPTQQGQPPYGGYPPQQAPSYPGQQQQPYGQPTSGSAGLFDAPSQQYGGGYPQQQPYGGQGGYPQQQQYGAQGGYPQQQQYGAQGGYPQQQPYGSQGGYPQQQQPSGGYLPPHIAQNPNFQPQNAGYCPPAAPGGYPQQPPAGGYQQPGGYPQQQMGGYAQPPSPIGNPTLRPYQPFNPNDDATKLYKAMKGLGTNETALIDVLCFRTFQQRNEIAQSFKGQYGKDLLKNICDEVSGNFELLFKSLLHPTSAHLDAHDLKHAIDGLGTNEAALIDIICTKTNSEMNALKLAYRQVHGKDLEREVGGEASGYFKRFLVSLVTANRSENPPDQSRATQLAQELYDAGEKRVGTNEAVFNRIFATESFAQLKLVDEQYRRISGRDLVEAIKREMSGDVERAFVAVAQTALHPPGHWAIRLHGTMAGSGTHDRSLVRIMAQRSERDMIDVKQDFQARYGKSLESFIKSDCSGDYKRGLLALAGDSHWR